ncbi:hypothetical protein M427DRAFT_176884 [Gonapodya prolifera JEL478]|uniref:Uncharacterized protein n=1 Tax=Gonapodya prolifera (strain JEL478) TaxID=1344416 RepID=A0A139AQP1_GONPJ|nr:hypothetical protein M427DRAFT_176884 [Gonapodya prolifera JEL478]|eukprot:KXS18823.1 hypothetical protein M427DRAFT_176884 [Gonapodya prolifera JEL478]
MRRGSGCGASSLDGLPGFPKAAPSAVERQLPSPDSSPKSGTIDSSDESSGSDDEYDPTVDAMATKSRGGKTTDLQQRSPVTSQSQRPAYPVINISVTGPQGETSPIVQKVDDHDDVEHDADLVKREPDDETLTLSHVVETPDAREHEHDHADDFPSEVLALLTQGDSHYDDHHIKLEDFLWTGEDHYDEMHQLSTTMESDFHHPSNTISVPSPGLSATPFPMPTFLPMAAVSSNNPMMSSTNVDVGGLLLANSFLPPSEGLDTVTHDHHDHLSPPNNYHHTRHLSLGELPLGGPNVFGMFAAMSQSQGNAPAPGAVAGAGAAQQSTHTRADAAAATAGRHDRVRSAPAVPGLDIASLRNVYHSQLSAGLSTTRLSVEVSPTAVSPTSPISPVYVTRAVSAADATMAPGLLQNLQNPFQTIIPAAMTGMIPARSRSASLASPVVPVPPTFINATQLHELHATGLLAASMVGVGVRGGGAIAVPQFVSPGAILLGNQPHGHGHGHAEAHARPPRRGLSTDSGPPPAIQERFDAAAVHLRW